MKTLTISIIIIFFYQIAFGQSQKLVMVVPPDKYHDTEFSDPMLALDSANINLIIASLNTGKVGGVHGDTIVATCKLSDIFVDDFDAICIMGGKGTGEYLWDNKEVNKLVTEFKEKDKLVTGICAGSVALAKAGIMQNVKATTYPVKGFIHKLEANNAIY